MIISKDKQGNWTPTAGGTGTFIGTLVAFNAIKDTLPVNTVAYITDDGESVTSKELKYSSFVNPSNYINSTYSSIRVIKKNSLTIINVFILVDSGVSTNTSIKITDNIKSLLEVDTFYNTEICIGGIVSNDNVALTDRKALLMLNPSSDSLSLKISSADGGWIKMQIII